MYSGRVRCIDDCDGAWSSLKGETLPPPLRIFESVSITTPYRNRLCVNAQSSTHSEYWRTASLIPLASAWGTNTTRRPFHGLQSCADHS